MSFLQYLLLLKHPLRPIGECLKLNSVMATEEAHVFSAIAG
ncbi:MAG: hypothetical protein V7K47_17770 [Nostoc sp.]